MRLKKIFTLIGTTYLLLYAGLVYSGQYEEHPIAFRSGSDVLYGSYGNNGKEVIAIKQLISRYEDVILTGNGHIRLVAAVSRDAKDDPVAMNMMALRAAVVRNFLKQNFRMLTNWNFTFCFDDNFDDSNTIKVEYIPYALPANVSTAIHYSNETTNLAAIKQALSKYGKLPYLRDIPAFEDDETARATFDKINELATSPVNVESIDGESNPEKVLIAIHYRWDKDYLDSLYLSNPTNLRLLDSILVSSNSKYIDTLTIVAYASPEGPPDYNMRLSERRAQTIKDYITNNYKTITPERIVTKARGENWDGLRNFVINDSKLPLRNEILNIIDSPLSDQQKQSQITKLNGGVTYYRYILPNYYRYLRNGASILITYSPELPKDTIPVIKKPEPEPIIIPEPLPIIIPETEHIVKYPIAFKTNLLFDAVGAPNIGVEIPIGKHFSVVGDFAYAYWRSPKNLYALQTLEGGVEVRYWFGVNDKKKLAKPEWAKPLRGWNVGLYGMYCSRYDIQWIDGYQGDGFWSAGFTAGYATPIARNLTLEFSLAAGYFYTPEYRHYHQPEYDANGKYHLMWQQTGSFGTFSFTKARISLVWLIMSDRKGDRR